MLMKIIKFSQIELEGFYETLSLFLLNIPCIRHDHDEENLLIDKHEISRMVKMSAYKFVYSPILSFYCENWNLTKKMKSLIQSTGMKYLRCILGITR